ncbi:OmpA family protein [Roseobacter sp. HKCCD9010]|uniref:OmpA family protein n=2 Tax=Rhodobacterales TaxID=204455 RepID=UPI001490A2E6|nr:MULTISPECIES: OmpA family protein [unclassified Roseobacter]MBF9049951.1 OmpA family protein [Rhodobacterales bacterium HKCCD4356]NNV13510.1 OmpA family protein [Roseobacter sp. HKCCD7357]NNV16343.1 OmpA family protein [Roseobacter sp. HKCCD8768]NNV25803.1 OmpA family protein [Roseobacter sp. HKCCD8192]NNV30059.1 OmpA family protein [Roseobacter sp. HKCCD9061]
MTLRKTGIAVTMTATLGLAACVPQGEPMGERTQTGLIAGALGGAVLGAAVDDDDRGRGALIGAAAGALAGGTIGQILDRQARDLRSSMANDQILINNTGEELIVTMPEGILFAVDSAAIRAGLQQDIRALARNLQQYPNSTVDVIGHTDNTGSASYNQDLSARRASAVAGVILEEGVNPGRIRSYGRGENEPVASNLTPEGRQLNRRVEIVIRPTR